MKTKGALILSVFITVAMSLSLYVSPSFAQDETPIAVTNQNRSGDLPFSSSVGTDVERVDPVSGNLIVTIPIASIPGRGMGFNFGLRYDARFLVAATRSNGNGGFTNVWNVAQGPYLPDTGTTGGLGWSTNQPTLTWASLTVVCSPDPYLYASIQFFKIYRDSSGVKHPFVWKTIGNHCGGHDIFDTPGPDLSAQGMTVGGNGTQGSLVTLSNLTTVANLGQSLTPPYYPTWTDPNGNQKNEGTGGVDTLGRNIVVEQDNTNQILYKVYDSNGVQQTYTVNFTTISLHTNFNVSGVTEYVGTRSAISSIVLPNGRSYQFQYETGTYGGITQITLPNGAIISYTWGTLVDGMSTHRYVTSRTVNVSGHNYVWQIVRSGSCANITATVTDPLQNASVYVSSTGGVTTASFYNGGATGNPYRRYDIAYAMDTDPQGADREATSSISFCDANYIGQRPISIMTTLDNNLVSKREFDYDSFTYTYHPLDDFGSLENNQPAVPYTTSRGNVTEIREFDWGTGTPGPLLRRTRKAYNYTILDKVTREIVCQPGATCDINNPTDEDARTDYVYDGSTLISTSSAPAPQHDYTNFSSTFTTRGNATQVKRWRSASDSAPLATNYGYDDLGNIRSITDPANNTTTWSYTDNWANSACAPPSGKNGQAYVYQKTNALSQIVQLAHYPCTGLVQSRKDQNDINASRAGTTVVYDLLGRLTQKNLPDGGQVSNSYNDSAPPSVTTTTKINSTTNMVSFSQKDGLGREVQSQQTSNPLCAVIVDTVYDALGRKASMSNPYCTTSDSTYGVTSFAYDILSRPTTVTQPGGATGLTSYTGRATSVSDEGNGTQTIQRISQTDGLGRLVSVCEVSSTSLTVGQGNVPSACNQDIGVTGFLTTYQYNLLGNLTQVSQTGVLSRNFIYDSLSRLTSASNPESGTITYKYDSDTACASPNSFNGLLVSKLDARNIRTCMQYDALNRNTQKNYSDGTSTASFLYDASTVTGLTTTLTNPVGRLIQASTSNTRTVNSYDSVGRATNQWQCTPQNCGSAWFPFAYVYDLAGDPTSSSNGVGTTFSYTYNAAAQLTSMTSSLSDANHPANLLSSTSYNALGALLNVSLGNATVEGWSYTNRAWLQSAAVGSSSGTGTHSTGTVSVSGSDGSFQVCEPNCRTIWDHGTKYLTVDAYTVSAGYTQSSTPSSIASALSSALNATGSPATATVNGAVITITSKVFGPAGNYSVSTSSTSYDPNDFGTGSFDFTPPSLTLTGGTGGLYTVTLTYAPDGDVLSANDTVNGNWVYAYDPFNRLTCSNLASNGTCASPTNGNPSYAYVYDRLSNRWQQNAHVSGGSSFIATFTGNNPGNPQNNNRMDSYSYDASGNLLNDGTHNYAFDAENRSTQVDNGTTATYVYDANGQRVRKTKGSTTVDYLYDLADHEIVEVSSTGLWNRAEIYAGGRHLATYATGATGVTYFNHADWLGTERMRTNMSAASCETVTSLPFGDGQTTSGSCGDPSPMHFTGKERDSESGLDDFGDRYYSSPMGRFTSVDPIWVKIDRLVDPQRLNLYAYGRNNPLLFVDPDGRDVTIGRCSIGSAQDCFNQLQAGLTKQDREHVKLVAGDGKNGCDKGVSCVKVDADYKSDSKNFQVLQTLANDHSAIATVDVLKPNDSFKLKTSISWTKKDGDVLGIRSTTPGFDGYTFFPYKKGDPGPFSPDDTTHSVINSEPLDHDIPATIHHEMRHIFLGDFGRSAKKAGHGQPGVDQQTKAAEAEAKKNEKEN